MMYTRTANQIMMTMPKMRHIFFTLGLGAPGAVVALSTSRIARRRRDTQDAPSWRVGKGNFWHFDGNNVATYLKAL